MAHRSYGGPPLPDSSPMDFLIRAPQSSWVAAHLIEVARTPRNRHHGAGDEAMCYFVLDDLDDMSSDDTFDSITV